MSTTLSVNPISVTVPWDYENSGYPSNPKDINTVTYAGPILTNGTGAGNANVKISQQLSIPASGSTTLTLNALSDSFGNSVTFARIKELYIENSAIGKSSAISVGGASSTPFQGIWSATGTGTNGGVINIRNGSCFHVGVAQDATAYPVGTGISLLITNEDSTNAATVNIVIIGCNA